MNAPALPFEAMAAGSAVTEQEIALGAGRPNPKRGALVVAAVAVLVVGGGLIVGAGSGEDGEQGQSPPPSTTVARPTTTERPTRTTVRRTTTTPTVPTYASQPIPELGGVPIYAVVSQRVLRIDSATGQTVVLGGPTERAQQNASLLPRTGGVVAWTDEAEFFPDDGTAPLSLGFGNVWPAADPSLIWQRNYRSTEQTPVRLLRVATGEEVALVSVPAYSYPVGDDGTGRLLVRAEAGGAFAVDPVTGAAARISDTSVVAATGAHLLALRCDDALVCGLERVDRATGEVTPATIDGAPTYGEYALDPTGTRVLILGFSYEGSPTLRLVELSTGAEVQLAAQSASDFGYQGVPASWTPDGQHVVGVDDSSIKVWTPGSDRPAIYPVVDADGDRASVTAVAVGR